METATQIQLLINRLEDHKITEEHWYLLTHEAEQAGTSGWESRRHGSGAFGRPRAPASSYDETILSARPGRTHP
jgi:hypothetical protein